MFSAALAYGLVTAAVAQSSGDGRRRAVAANPTPKLGYRVTLRFADLPAPLARVAAYAAFEVENRACVPLDYARAAGGVTLPPTHQMDLALDRQTDGSYLTTVFADALADTDLFGLGVCQWALRSMTVAFDSTGTQFIGGATADQIRSGTHVSKYYLARDFTQKPPVGDFVFGEDPAFYLKSLGPQFTLRIVAEQMK